METAADLKNKGFVTAKPAAVATLAAPTEVCMHVDRHDHLPELATDREGWGDLLTTNTMCNTANPSYQAATRKVSLAPDPAKEEDLKSLFETFDMDGAGANPPHTPL